MIYKVLDRKISGGAIKYRSIYVKSTIGWRIT